MDLRYSAQDEEFRAEVREWLAKEVPAHGPPPPPGDWPARRAYDTAWQRKLYDAGYAGLAWPAEFGGRGLPITQQLVYLEEYSRAEAPYISVNFVGLMHAGPTLIAEGSDEQRRTHLPRILRGDAIWCQGFSEPGAGSDLASLCTRAERDGDDYVVSGQKIWSTRAHVADYCELLVRTDPAASKHKGITWLILDMHQPGVEVRPMRTLDGESHFCELFLDEVARPRDEPRGGGERRLAGGQRDAPLRTRHGVRPAHHHDAGPDPEARRARAGPPIRTGFRLGLRRGARQGGPARGQRRGALADDPDVHRRSRANRSAGALRVRGQAPLQRAEPGDRRARAAARRASRSSVARTSTASPPRRSCASTCGRCSTRSPRARPRSSAT